MGNRRLLGATVALVASMIGCGRSPLDLDDLDGAPGAGGIGVGASSVDGSGGSAASVTGAGGVADGSGGAVTGGDPQGAGGARAATTGAGGEGAAGGDGPGPDPLSCITCVASNCPETLECIQDPACGQGLLCTFTDCLGGGSPDLMCVADCFDGDISAALEAIQALSCVLGTCGDVCGGLIPGLPGG